MERESLDGREGDDERTENERSPPPRSRPTTRDHARKEAERRRSRGNTPAKDVVVVVDDQQDRKRRHSRSTSRSRSALRDRDQSELNENNIDKKIKKPKGNNASDNTTINIITNNIVNNNKTNGNNHDKGHDQDTRGENGSSNGMKKRRRRNRSSRKRHQRGHHNHRHDNHNRKYKPYTELSWEERQERDEQESQRAAQRRANRPTPYNTTQFLMEDHKVDTPDLSSAHHNMRCDASDHDIHDIEDEMNGEYLEKDFSAVYEEVQSERLESMSKEQLVTEVLTLQRRVTELEEEQKRRLSSAGESDQSSSGQPVDKGLRKRLESLSSLEGEVQRLRSENTRLRKTSPKEPIAT